MNLKTVLFFSLLLCTLAGCGNRMNITELAFVSQHHIQVERLMFDNSWEVGGGEFSGGEIVGSKPAAE